MFHEVSKAKELHLSTWCSEVSVHSNTLHATASASWLENPQRWSFSVGKIHGRCGIEVNFLNNHTLGVDGSGECSPWNCPAAFFDDTGG